MKDFGLACVGWQAPVCDGYAEASQAVDALNRDLGCSATMAFSSAIWSCPQLKADADWCQYVVDVWVPQYRLWASRCRPWGWKGGNGAVQESVRRPHSSARREGECSNPYPEPPPLWLPD